MRIGLLGDVHGNYDIFYGMLMHMVENQKISVAFQVGDFGLSEAVLKHKEIFDLPVPLYVIDGNHEDFRFLAMFLRSGLREKWASHNLYYQPRGSTENIQGTQTGFIGGGLHVDQPQQRKNGNVITNDEVNSALKEFNENPPQIVVSHSCPAGIGLGMLGHPSHARGVVEYIVMAGYDPGPSCDYGETQLTSLWERLEKRPKLWIYGHFHQFQSRKIEDTLFICLPRIDFFHQYVVWDTETEEIILNYYCL